jgi:Serine/threonine protein phosphatase
MELYREYVTSGNDEEVGKHVLEEVITDDDILDVVLEEPSLSSAAEQFVDLSNRKGGKDNISLILFSGSSLPNSPDPKEGVLPERALDPDTPISEQKNGD